MGKVNNVILESNKIGFYEDFMQSKVDYEEVIQKYNDEIQGLEEEKNTIQNDYFSSSDEIEGKLFKINNVIGIDGYLSKEDVEFYEEYANALKKSKTDLEDIYNSTIRSIDKRIETRNEEIKEETIEKELEENEKSGMYFLYAHASFYWDLEKGKVFVEMTFGPRFGRGYSYDIDKKEDDYELINEEIQWVS